MAFRTILLLPCLWLSLSVYSQAPYLYFNRITVQNGLSHNKVNCILQDRRGFIWIGTDDGLNRYDGSHFTTFRHRPHDPSTISGNIINDLIEDSAGVLWVATGDGGITRYDYRLPPASQFRQFKHLPHDSASIPVNIINDLIEDHHGYLWLASDGKGVFRFNKKSERFQVPAQSGTLNAVALCLDGRNELWAGRQGGGILKMNTADLSYSMDDRYEDLYANLPHAAVSSLFRDRDGDIWFGSWDRVLYRYNHRLKKEEEFAKTNAAYSFGEDDILSFAQDSMGRIWMGGRYNGLTLFDPARQCFFNYRYDASSEGTVADNRINCIFIDHSGLVWLGTNKGISMYNPRQQPFVQTFLPGNGRNITIYDFYKDEEGLLWIGTSNGLYTKADNDRTLKHIPLSYKGHPLTVSSFYRDADGSLYLGTNFSLFVFDRKNQQLSLLPNTEKDIVIYDIIESRVVSMVRDTIDGHPALLVSPYGHYLAYYDFRDRQWVSRTDTVRKIISNFNLQDNLVRRLYKGRAGELWLATAKAGLGEWNKARHEKIKYHLNDPAAAGSISNDNVYDLAADARNNIWVTTYGGGLNKYDPVSGSFSHIAAASNLLEGVQADRQGNVWMIGNGNLHCYRPVSSSFSSFALPDLQKSGGVHGYIYQDKAGMMYVAGTNYYIAFDPRVVKTELRQPKVYFTDFRIFNDSYSHLLHRQRIPLRYNENYFTVEFSAPQFAGGKVEYSYQLAGIDKTWIEAGDRNIVSYSNLRGGDYLFRVRATNRKGEWSSDYATLSISIIPPFWERWWFYACCSVLAAAAIYGSYRYRINELLKRQAIRNRIAQDLHDNVGSTLSSISVYSQVAKIYKEQHKQEGLQDTLERIGAASTEMISEMNDIVWAINPRNDNMGTILQRMESYARPLLQSKEIGFSFEFDPGMEDLNLQMEQRKNFYLIFKEAVSNALKYAAPGRIDVRIKHRHRWVEMSVQDNGKGFEWTEISVQARSSLSGNGLLNMKRRAVDLKGECTITSMPGLGTTVRLKFPVT